MRIRSYRELRRINDFEERYDYLKLSGEVGRATFGYDRKMNQKFYKSKEWRDLRHHVITRDFGCDLGVEGYEIHSGLYIHHMNPLTMDTLIQGNDDILDPEYLITTTHRTHNAIHYGDARQLMTPFKDRTRGDTKLW